MSDKIKPHHLQRKAINYVRQSSPYQVQHNQESRRLQDAMKQRPENLGWHEIETIDDDLGTTAAGTVTRQGFERRVAEVCLGKVGVVTARELSRFARNNREWQLIEMCRVVDTLLLDQEMAYAPREGNDRLLLGLKWSLNEYKLDLLRARSVAARHAKARRGELVAAAPVGFLKTEDQRLEKNPDRRVQEAVLSIFRKFREIGSVRQTLLWFLEEGLLLPARQADGTLLWKRPIYAALRRALTNPFMAAPMRMGKRKRLFRMRTVSRAKATGDGVRSPVEAACKQVVNQRLKGAGMRWCEPMAGLQGCAEHGRLRNSIRPEMGVAELKPFYQH